MPMPMPYPRPLSPARFIGDRVWHVVGILVLLTALLLFASPRAWAASDAKTAYLSADAAYKRLRNSPTKRQKISEWLQCIDNYQSIYKRYPESAWAPAGMYKAAELHLKLHKISRNAQYQSRALDLLARLKNKYPRSAYTKRAKGMERAMLASVLPKATRPAVPHITSKVPSKPKHIPKATSGKKKKPPTLISAKELKSKNQNQMDRLQHQAAPTPAPAVQPQSRGDAVITSLRHWSNPEYSRIVINGTNKKPFSYGLLKKDPAINRPFPRLYVDISDARLGNRVSEHTLINDNLLKQARAGQYKPHVVRVVVDIKSFDTFKIFSLADPFRIVIDIYDKGASPVAATPVVQSDSQVATTPPSAPVKNSPITTDNLKSSDIARQLALGVRKIVIDPGHGGVDPGAPGYVKGVWEKDIVLKLANNLAGQLRRKLDCEVLLTRTTDKKLTLEERTAFANTQRADLFISLHCNAARNKKLRGIETYILNLATDDAAIAVAARENATSEKNISDLEFILSDLMKHAKIEESTRLAHDVQNAMVKGMQKKYSKIKNLGVKQAPFYVLLGARMPAILIEASFLSNKTECKRLMDPKYQNDICHAITTGIAQYIDATNPRKL